MTPRLWVSTGGGVAAITLGWALTFRYFLARCVVVPVARSLDGSLWACAGVGAALLSGLAYGLLGAARAPLRPQPWFHAARTPASVLQKSALPTRLGLLCWLALSVPGLLLVLGLGLTGAVAVTALWATQTLGATAAFALYFLFDQQLRRLLATTSLELEPAIVTPPQAENKVARHLFFRTGVLVLGPLFLSLSFMLLLTHAESDRLDAHLAATTERALAQSTVHPTPLRDAERASDVRPTSTGRATGAVCAGLFALVGLAVALHYGRWLTTDFRTVTLLARHAGTEPTAPRPVTPPVRFEETAWLLSALRSLTGRFHGFAAAQERALNARKAALRTRNLLFASVSHDLKNPLHAILGFCEVAAQQPLTDPQRDSLRIIERRGRELLALLEIILDSARMEAGHFSLDRTPCDPQDVLQRALQRGNDLGPTHATPVEVVVPAGLPTVLWDEDRIAQALGALLGHAKRLSPGGGVRLEVSWPEASTLRMTLLDPSGVFSPQELERLFDANQAATAPKRLGGLALGLSLAKSLIVMHRGTLGIRQEPGGAYRFEVNLPISLQLPPYPTFHVLNPSPRLGRRGTL